MDVSVGRAWILPDPPHAHVVMRGELDLVTAPEISAQFRNALRAGCRHFRVDLVEVSFCDASTVALLVGLDRHVRAADGSLCIVDASRCVRRVFALVGLGSMLDPARAPAL